jgi:transcriptional repressor NrdR
MICPFCKYSDTKVVDSRITSQGESQVKRRRCCPECQERFTTYESPELMMPRVIKRDGSRVDFAEKKLRHGLLKAFEKRPFSAENFEKLFQQILRDILKPGEREIKSDAIGKLIMEALKTCDHVAYVRFASVYWAFDDAHAFIELINNLQTVEKQTQEC